MSEEADNLNEADPMSATHRLSSRRRVKRWRAGFIDGLTQTCHRTAEHMFHLLFNSKSMLVPVPVRAVNRRRRDRSQSQ